jgi:PQQ-like domain
MRRTSVFTALMTVAATAALTLSATAAGAASAAPWREGDYGAARTSYNPNETLVSASSVSHVTYLRTITAPPAQIGSFGCGNGVATQPVVVDHRLFVVLTNKLVSIDLTNGHTLWSVQLDATGTNTYPNLAVVGSRVILASLDCTSASDPSGSVAAYSIANGTQSWKQFMDPGPQYMTVWLDHVIYTGYEAGGGGDLVSLDVNSGAVQWTYAPGFCDAMGRPVVVGGVILATGCDASFDAQLEGHSLSTGALTWVKAGVWDTQRGTSSYASTGKDAYVRNLSSTALTDVDPKTGRTRWVFTELGDALAVDNHYLYTDCQPDTLCAVVKSTGIIAWMVPEYGIANSGVAAANGLVFVGVGYGNVLTFDGSPVNDRFGEPLSIWSEPEQSVAVANGRLVVSSGRIIDVYKVPGA